MYGRKQRTKSTVEVVPVAFVWKFSFGTQQKAQQNITFKHIIVEFQSMEATQNTLSRLCTSYEEGGSKGDAFKWKVLSNSNPWWGGQDSGGHLQMDKVPRPSSSSFLFPCHDKHHDQKQPREERICFILYFLVTGPSLREIKPRSWRNADNCLVSSGLLS